MTNVAVFASGSGTNAEVLFNYFDNHQSISINCLISNRKNAMVYEKAKAFNSIKPFYIYKDDWQNPEILTQILEANQVEYIVLAGFLLKIPAYIVDQFPDRIINIHPSLLPKYGGKGMYGMHVHKAVKENKENETGITIHLVNQEFDKGRVLQQEKCAVLDTDSIEEIANKVQKLEHAFFAQTIEKYITSKK